MRPAGEKIRLTLADRERVAWMGLGLAMAAAAILILWESRGMTFSVDELVWFMESPDLDLHRALEPHGGHLTLTTRVAYKLLLSVFGSAYLPFRILTIATILLAVALFFVFAKRRVGGLAALAPCLVLLVFGSDSLHVLTGNGFTVVFALACGIAALLALERGDRAGDLVACGLLCLGIATYTVALGFIVAVAVFLLLRRDRWRRGWIAAVPLALYGAWWLWSLRTPINGESQVTFWHILRFPAAAYEACSTVLGALSGLDYSFGGATAEAGPALALIAFAAIAWRLWRGDVPDKLWALLAVPAVSWALVSLARFRTPDEPRYLFPSAIAVLLVAAEALAPVRWSRFSLAVLFAVAAVGVVTNVALMRDYRASSLSTYVAPARAEESAIDLADSNANSSFDPADSAGIKSSLAYPFAEVRARGEPPTATYLKATERYGSPGYPPQAIPAQPEPIRARTDSVLADALNLALVPAGSPPIPRTCRVFRAATGRGVSIELPAGGVVLSTPGGGPVAVRRFASASIPVGDLRPGIAADLKIPDDRAGPPWRLLTAATPLRVCGLR